MEVDVSMSADQERRISVAEIYGPVLQGEGPLVGAPTHFLRTAGCDYKCTACDSMFAVDPNHPDWDPKLMSPEEIYHRLYELYISSGVKRVTISGGNPAIHRRLQPTIEALSREIWDIWVETQGTIYSDWLRLCNGVVVSPKTRGMGEKFEPSVFAAFMGILAKKPSMYQEHVYVKVPCYTEEDLDQAFEMFRIADGVISREYAYHMRYSFTRYFVSQVNPCPEGEPNLEEYMARHRFLTAGVLSRLAKLKRASQMDVRVIPQMHVLAYGNAREK